ncbi:MAG: di-heme enzyme [Myxococcales bacterium]|nr:di-heme enzyme [Myxococcales bacterium]
MLRRALVAAAVLAACDEPPAAYAWDLPAWLPEPHVPADNPMSEEKVALGRALFYDERLSHNETMSCASCHEQARAFTDGKATTEGSTGHALPRNAMGLTNVAYLSVYTWANPKLVDLEGQALVPMFADFPLELGVQQDTPAILKRFRDDADMAGLFAAAFPDDEDPVTVERITHALASFQRTLIARDSAYDRAVYGEDPSAMSAAARRGLRLFFDERTECYHCHAGVGFTTAFRSADSELGPPDFQNNGLYNLDGAGAYPIGNGGLYDVTGDPRDQGKFRVPTLRNIALTAPYMHDGSIATLAEVVEHYAAGGREIEDGPFAGDGRRNPNKSALIHELDLTADEKADLVAFLESLTDVTLTTDPRFGPP